MVFVDDIVRQTRVFSFTLNVFSDNLLFTGVQSFLDVDLLGPMGWGNSYSCMGCRKMRKLQSINQSINTESAYTETWPALPRSTSGLGVVPSAKVFYAIWQQVNFSWDPNRNFYFTTNTCRCGRVARFTTKHLHRPAYPPPLPRQC